MSGVCCEEIDVTQILQPIIVEVESSNILSIGISAYEHWLMLGNVGTEQDFINSLVGKSAYQIALDNGFLGTEQEWLDSLRTPYVDIELAVTQDDQVEFNIFSEPTQSNLFINDSVYFKGKSYQIQNISGNWKMIWLNEFLLKTNDLLIFRKF